MVRNDPQSQKKWMIQVSDSLAVVTDQPLKGERQNKLRGGRDPNRERRLRYLSLAALYTLCVMALDAFFLPGIHLEVLYLPAILFVLRSANGNDLYLVAGTVTVAGIAGVFVKAGAMPPLGEWWHITAEFAVLWGMTITLAYLKEALWLQATVLENTAEGIVTLDDRLRIISFNASAEAIFGYDREDILGKEFIRLLCDGEGPEAAHLLAEMFFTGGAGNCMKTETTGRRSDRAAFPLEISVRAARVRGRRRYYVVLNDVTGLRQTREQLWKLSNAVEQSSASTIITNIDGTIEYVNRRFCDLSGYQPEDVLGRNASMLRSDDPQAHSGLSIWETINSGREWRGEFHNRKKNGDYYWVEAAISPIKKDGRITHFLSIQEDISVRKDYEDKLLRQANFDELTGLPNRLLALDRMSQALENRKTEQTYVAVMIVDLDQFNAVNDTLGHHNGDLVIRETGRRLRNILEKSVTLARLGGDEFLVILPGITSAKMADKVAGRILEAIESPFVIDEHEIYGTASIGVSIAPDDGLDAHSLLKNADAALFLAKKDGRNTYRFFKSRMNEVALRRLEMVTKLRKAIANEELSVHYQPLIDIDSGQMVALEALVRWNHPVEGFIPPDQFIPIAEETGLIKEIGDGVLRRACRDVKELMSVLQRPLKVAVNISVRQFKDGNFDEKVLKIVAENGLVPEYLELELTERLLMLDDPETAGVLRRLSKAGVSLSIDDFGTGYSSLSYLKRYPFDVLKIDRAFVKDVIHDSQNAALVSAIIAMAQSLDLKVIAEGVEEEAQLAFLRRLKCDIAQGYLLGRPMSFDDLAVKWSDQG